MSAILQTNRLEKWQRLTLLVEQGSITWKTALLWYINYCRLFEQVKK